jgi:hypothetical protein
MIQRHGTGVVLGEAGLNPVPPALSYFPEPFRAFAMAPVINLRIERKRAKRRQAEEDAASRRLAHGRSKPERNLERSRNDKAVRSLDQHRIETGDGK